MVRRKPRPAFFTGSYHRLALWCCLLAVSPLPGQSGALLYDFIRYDQNQIDNTAALSHFYKQLNRLEKGEIDRVSVVHIGDSHIQADIFSGVVRQELQQLFGVAGRGLVFPHRLGGAHGPVDLKVTDNGEWLYRRSAFRQAELPMGLSGACLRTSQPDFIFELSLRNDSLGHYAFDQVTVFYECGPHAQTMEVGNFDNTKPARNPVQQVTRYHTVRSGDNLYNLARKYGCSVKDLQRWNKLHGNMIRPGQKLALHSRPAAVEYDGHAFQPLGQVVAKSEKKGPAHATLKLDTLLHQLAVRGSGQPGTATLYGLVLENSGRPGLLYHSIGVNGVTFYHYNRCAYFRNQLVALRPDLLIISLGTNDAASANFEAAPFEQEARALIDGLLEDLPEADLLLMTNPDYLRRGRYENRNCLQTREILSRIAEEKDLACWDFYEIMGGFLSIKKWVTAGLAQRDHIHFSRDGYELQGHLLTQALLKSYVAGN